MQRGVYTANWRSSAGQEVLLALDGDGRRVAEATVRHPEHRERVVEHLTQLLRLCSPERRQVRLME